MKKIAFNDTFLLTKAVLEGKKTQVRTIIPSKLIPDIVKEGYGHSLIVDTECLKIPMGFGQIMELSRYTIGEIVAVAQKYSDAIFDSKRIKEKTYKDHSGWNNKMNVRADLMPHRIQITKKRIERLQDISEEDCLAEGIEKRLGCDAIPRYYVHWKKHQIAYASDDAKDACHFLVDMIFGRDTWESNPWVFVYDFKLIK